MRAFARLIVMWLIAMALPIQGVAAATMLHCGSATPAWPSTLQSAHAHHHDEAASSVPAVAHLAAHSGHHPGAVADDASNATPSHHHAGGNSGCSACASCCSALALPVTPVLLASQPVADTVSAAGPLPTVVFLTDGPERPPRTISV
jgi:hypothetical protein